MALGIWLLASLSGLVLYYTWKYINSDRVYLKVVKGHGCELPPRIPNQRPFGLDRIEQLIRADFEGRLMQAFTFHMRTLGPTVEQYFLAGRAYGTIDPRNLEVVLSSNFEDYDLGIRRKVMFDLFGDGIFTQDGPAWKKSRKLLQPQFLHRQYEDLQVIRESTNDLLEVLPPSGVVDLQPYIYQVTLDVTTAFLFGESVKSVTSAPMSKESRFGLAFNLAQDYIAKRLRLQDLYFLIGGKEFREACSNVHRFADLIIEKNLTRDKDQDERRGKYVFLDTLAENISDRLALRSQIINILVAGRDTTACCVSWTFFHLMRHPKVFQKLKDEIATSLGGRTDFSRTDLKKLQYLHNVIKEILRLYPSIPVNSRIAVKDTKLPFGGGPDGQSPVFIPKGGPVAYCAYALHRRPELYGLDAEIFRPERWSEKQPLDNDPVTAAWGYLPFNGGPRICLGMDFGLTEAAYIVVSLIQRYPNMTLPPGEKVEIVGTEKQSMTLVVQITEGCKVQLA